MALSHSYSWRFSAVPSPRKSTANMMAVDASGWDETVCNMVACQHPPCWEALRRIEKGVPRILFKISGRDSPEPRDEVPTLKIVDLPFDCSEKGHVESSESSTSISKTISNIRNAKGFQTHSTLNEMLFPPVSVVRSASSEKNSRVEFHTPHCTPTGVNYWRPTMQVADLSVSADPDPDQQTPHPSLVVRWVPGIRHKLLQPENSTTSIETSASQRMRVKDLALEGILSLSEKPEFKRKKSSKIPTGGQPYRLHLMKPEKAPNYRASFAPLGKERTPNVSPSRKRQYRPQRSPLVVLRSDSAVNLKSRKERWMEDKEKLVLPIIVKKAPSLNKCDSEVNTAITAALKEKGQRKQLEKTSKPTSRGSVSLSCLGTNSARQHEDPALTTKLPRKAFAEKGLQREASARRAPSRGKPSVKFVEFKSNKTDLSIDTFTPLSPSPKEGLQFPAGRALVSRSSPNLSPPLPRTESLQSSPTRIVISRSSPGYDSCTSRIPRSKSYYNVLCKITAKQEAAVMSQDMPLESGGEQWPKGATQKSEEILPPTNPPPPPPSSPLLSEISETCFPDLT
ncbi:hypothetical protein lerEdw1_015267 [Lerista edwardsae]|nr:hypothetical protein lerEdw1_015267 [Lerista edwardsae]